MRPIRTIVSGGQTGVDRAALDAALAASKSVGGWCPAGRRAEDGPLDGRYPLVETPSAEYAERTAWNVRDSDGTLILLCGEPSGGTALTAAEARRFGRALLIIDLDEPGDPCGVVRWVAAQGIAVLNVAGPRESEAPGIYERAYAFLRAILRCHAAYDGVE